MLNLSLNELLEYTAWERQTWHSWFRQNGEQDFELSAGPNGDGRFALVGDVVKHIFSAEKRYVERLNSQPLTDVTALPNDLEALFEFSQQSRRAFTQLLEEFPAGEWDTPRDFKI